MEGALHLLKLNDNQATPKYGVGFATYQTGGAMKMKEFVGETALRDYLTKRIHVHSDIAEHALRELLAKETADVPHVQLSDAELVNLGLKD